jgi:single-strand DNA-binding protein
MAGEPQIVIMGNVAGEPELRFTAGGHAVVNFTVAQTPRSFDKDSQQWVDGETFWFRCSAWRELAENISESITKGTRVVVTGKLEARSFETKSGDQRTNWELLVDDIGPSLRFATAQVNRTPKQDTGFGATAQGNDGWGGWG